MRYFNKILLWTYLKFRSIMVNISIALHTVEEESLYVNPFNIKEGDKHVQRMRHRNKVLEKFYAGKTDEKYVQNYYEILKKADKFMKTATPDKVAVTADKRIGFGMYGHKDKYGKRYEHYGFFDEKHKHAGKTLGEVLEMESNERRTKDDDYEIIYIINNKPVEVGLAKVMDIVEETDLVEKVPVVIFITNPDETKTEKIVDYVEQQVFEVQDIYKKSQSYEFPIKVHRNDENVINKIEQLTEYLHIKMIGMEYRQFEFFIPLKYKTEEIEENSQIYLDIINFDSIFVRNQYGELMSYGVHKLIKRIRHNDTHEVWKFEGIEIQDLGMI